MALRWECAESSQVCSKFRLSPAMVRTSRLAARLFALRTRTKWKKVYTQFPSLTKVLEMYNFLKIRKPNETVRNLFEIVLQEVTNI